MTDSDNLPASYTTWSNTQVVAWAEGVGPCFYPYLSALRKSNVGGQWLSCLTDSDLQSLGVFDTGDLRNIQAAVSGLIEGYADLVTENMQSLLFSVMLSTGQFAVHLKRAHPHEMYSQITEHHLMKCLLRLGFVVKKAISWLERSPFLHISKLAALRGVILRHTVDLNEVFQSALKNASLLAYVSTLLELTRELRDQLEIVIHDCDDSILLTPCTVEYVSLQKSEKKSCGIEFVTNECNVHVIQSLNSDIQAPAILCGRLTAGDEIIEVDHQLVLGWEHTSVTELLQQSSRRLDLRVRKRPAHCTDYFSVNSHRQRMQLMASSLRPFTAEPQHSRRSDILRNRTPKRRIKLLANAEIASTTSVATSASMSHEEEKEEETEMTNFEADFVDGCPKSLAPFRLCRERYCPAGHPTTISPSTHTSVNLGTSAIPPPSSPNEYDWRAMNKPSTKGPTTPPVKNQQSPAAPCLLDKFSAPEAVGSTHPSNSCLTMAKYTCQDWLWLKKRSSTSFGSRYVKRWCVFKQNTLYYYRNRDDENAEGLILLHGFTISPVVTDSGRSCRYPFRVYNEWTRFVFAADSEGARTRWMNMLGLAAIGQSAYLWTSPIGGFHPGYLPMPSSTASGDDGKAVEVNSSGSNEVNKSRGQPVTVHRCSSSLNVLSSSGTQPISLDSSPLSSPQNQSDPRNRHRHFLCVSASCLVSESAVSFTNDEVEKKKAADTKAYAAKEPEVEERLESEVRVDVLPENQSCRLTRGAAMIRRRRVRCLTEGSISPTVFLTSIPMILRPFRATSETVVIDSNEFGRRQHSHPQNLHCPDIDSGGDDCKRGSDGGSLLLPCDSNRLTPTCLLSGRSSDSHPDFE